MIDHAITFLKLMKWKAHIWLPSYLAWKSKRMLNEQSNSDVIDVMVVVVDHFEPARKEGRAGVQKVRNWCHLYEKTASTHHDSDGIKPQHTWFYRYDYPNFECIQILSEFVFKQLGEIEFHLHHGQDTEESFLATLTEGVEWFNGAGAMVSSEERPQKHFAYIAGNWALDNGRRNPTMSGVNRELMLLRSAGCYADFTFPAFGTNAQPRKVNTIYYAKDTPAPKSYDVGTDVLVGGRQNGDLMIFQGPLYVDWNSRYIENAGIEWFSPFFTNRIDHWISANIHIQGRPEWKFIKLHTHGIQSAENLFEYLDAAFSELERRFKASPFRLHYVTAREAYNIVKAAEAGLSGNPDDFRDFCIKPPVNRRILGNQPYRTAKFSEDHIILENKPSAQCAAFHFNGLPLKAVSGTGISGVEICFDKDELKHLEVTGDRVENLTSDPPFEIRRA
jgi:hypothetical protein